MYKGSFVSASSDHVLGLMCPRPLQRLKKPTIWSGGNLVNCSLLYTLAIADPAFRTSGLQRSLRYLSPSRPIVYHQTRRFYDVLAEYSMLTFPAFRSEVVAREDVYRAPAGLAI